MANVPAWQRNRAAGIGGQGSARANRAAAAQLPGPAEAKPAPVPAPAPAPVQAQGRDVVSQEGKQGIMGRSGNFQPLGRAALRGLGRSVVGASANAPAPVPTGHLGGFAGAPGAGVPNAGGVGGAADPTAAGATLTAPVLPPTAETPGIESAISNLRAQLGESMPNAPGVGGAPGAGLTASTLPTTANYPQLVSPTRDLMTKPNFRGAGTAGGAGGVPGAGMPSGNPLLDLLRARLPGAAAGGFGAGLGAGSVGGNQYAY